MPRAQSKIMSKADKKAKLDDLRFTQTSAATDLKVVKSTLVDAKKAVTTANKAAKTAQSAVNQQQKVVDKAKAAVAKLRAA